MFIASGWLVQTKDRINLSAACGVVICELSFATGEPDYVLFVEGKAIGTIEAKPEGETLTGVEEQSTKYVSGVLFGLPNGFFKVEVSPSRGVCRGFESNFTFC